MIKTAKQIRKYADNTAVVAEQVKNILRVIEADVEKSVELGLDSAITQLPVNFRIPPMKKIKAQRTIYYHIVR